MPPLNPPAGPDQQAAPAAQQGAPVAQPQVQGFALSPAEAQGNAILDFSTKLGNELYKSAVAPLKEEFNCTPHDLRLFLQDLETRADKSCWTEILDVALDPSDLINSATLNLIKDYGHISLEQVQNFARTFIGHQSRAAQDDAQLYLCVMRSLSKEARSKVTLKKKDYMIDFNNVEYTCGIALLKVVIQLSHIDTNATVRALRQELSSLDTYMVKVNSNIELFNQYVRATLDALRARGHDSEDLLTNLFKGYSACADRKF